MRAARWKGPKAIAFGSDYSSTVVIAAPLFLDEQANIVTSVNVPRTAVS